MPAARPTDGRSKASKTGTLRRVAASSYETHDGRFRIEKHGSWWLVIRWAGPAATGRYAVTGRHSSKTAAVASLPEGWDS